MFNSSPLPPKPIRPDLPPPTTPSRNPRHGSYIASRTPATSASMRIQARKHRQNQSALARQQIIDNMRTSRPPQIVSGGSIHCDASYDDAYIDYLVGLDEKMGDLGANTCLICRTDDSMVVDQVHHTLKCSQCHVCIPSRLSYTEIQSRISLTQALHSNMCPIPVILGYHVEEGLLVHCVQCQFCDVIPC